MSLFILIQKHLSMLIKINIYKNNHNYFGLKHRIEKRNWEMSKRQNPTK